jgi:hypothetical protein
MNAQNGYSTAFSLGQSTVSVDPGLDISATSSVVTGLQDPLSSSFSSSIDSTRSTFAGSLGVDPASDPLAVTSAVRANPVANWTVMVYIASDNLETFAIQDFLEMAAVGSQNGVNILVQFDRSDASSYSTPTYDNTSYGNWTDTRRGAIYAGSTPTQDWGYSLGEVNMGDAAVLNDFLNWGMSNYQANNYALVLWGHGNGFGTSMDETGDLLTGSEVASALATLPSDLALVAADSCLMGTVEFAYELSKDAGIFVSSQELVSGYGFEYTSIMTGLTTNPQWSAVEFGNALVTSYSNYYNQVNSGFEETISLIDLKAIGGLVSAIDQFASTVMASATSYDTYVLDWYRDYFANAFGNGDYPSYVDIGNVFSYFVSYATTNPTYITAAVSSAAQSILNAYDAVVVDNYTAAANRSTGLSIYFSNKGYFPISSYTGTSLSFAANTQWDEFLNWSGW